MKEHQLKSIKKDLRVGIGILIVLAFVFGIYLVSVPLATGLTIVSFLFYIIFVGLYVLQGNPMLLRVTNSEAMQRPKLIILLPVLLWSLSLLYALMSRQFNFLLLIKGFFFCLIPALLVYSIRAKQNEIHLADLAIILLMWLPIEFGLVMGLKIPPIRGAVDVYHIIGIILIIFFYFAVRNLKDIGFTYRLKDKDIRVAIKNFALFIPMALIIGLATHFIAVSRRLPSGFEMIVSFLGIAFFIALPEEILFRGVIHNLIEKQILKSGRSRLIALTISSLIFGLAHGNNHNPPFLDINFGPLGVWHAPWVYILLATLAGYFYGWTFIKTRKVTAAAIVHLLVDWVWGTFFSG